MMQVTLRFFCNYVYIMTFSIIFITIDPSQIFAMQLMHENEKEFLEGKVIIAARRIEVLEGLLIEENFYLFTVYTSTWFLIA
jgi:hypothetical protein